MTPVMYLSDGYLANGSEPWKIPSMDDLKPFQFGWGLDKDNVQALHAQPWRPARALGPFPGTPEASSTA